MIVTNTSTLFDSNGQFFNRSEYQGSLYQEVTFSKALKWDNKFTITEPLNEALYNNTISNYPVGPNKYFMGSFDGFWIHRIYNRGNLVMTVQSVDQEMFIPVAHDRVESIAMASGFVDPTGDCDPPDVPAPGVLAVLGIAAMFGMRKRK